MNIDIRTNSNPKHPASVFELAVLLLSLLLSFETLAPVAFLSKAHLKTALQTKVLNIDC